MKLAVFGTGYVGLTLAACLAEVGHWVCCVDVDAERIDALSRGHCPIFEPGLPALLHKGLASSRLLFSTDAVPAIEAASVIFIAVGTPPLADGSAPTCVRSSRSRTPSPGTPTVRKSSSTNPPRRSAPSMPSRPA